MPCNLKDSPGLCLEGFLGSTVIWVPVSVSLVKCCLLCVSQLEIIVLRGSNYLEIIREVIRGGISSAYCWVPRAGALAAHLRDEDMGSQILLLGLACSKR